jgi:GT2 family glycosyltransferase
MTPALSIIIPTWNTVDITLKCIRTINQYLPLNFSQIIIVDNGSTDNSQEILSIQKNVTYIKNDVNLGFAKGNNIGAKSATGRYLLFLNSDMELTDSSLVSMVKYLDEHSDVGIIGPRFLNPDMTIQGSVLPPQTPLNAIEECWLNQSSYVKYAPANNSPTEVWAISGGAVVINHQYFKKIGGWDEKYFFYYEDLELCRQIRHLHKKIIYFPECHVIHRHGASGKTVADPGNQWRRLIPSSILYHGKFMHYLLFLIIWSSQKWQKKFSTP